MTSLLRFSPSSLSWRLVQCCMTHVYVENETKTHLASQKVAIQPDNSNYGKEKHSKPSVASCFGKTQIYRVKELRYTTM